MAEPIQTLVREARLDAPMKFALQPGVEVAFTGDVHLHGYVMHSFAGECGRPWRGVCALTVWAADERGLTLSLSARARQFSSFLVLVGRVSGAGLFDPQFGMIVQNKDEVTIPLDLETIPSAGEFKAGESVLVLSCVCGWVNCALQPRCRSRRSSSHLPRCSAACSWPGEARRVVRGRLWSWVLTGA